MKRIISYFKSSVIMFITILGVDGRNVRAILSATTRLSRFYNKRSNMPRNSATRKIISLAVMIACLVFVQGKYLTTDVYAGQTTPGGYIVSALNQYKAVDVNGGNINNGTKIQIWDFNRTNAQGFRFEKKGRYYAIVHSKSGKVLDVDGGKAQNGIRVILWSYHGGKNQLWTVRREPGGYYTFQSALGNYFLDVSGGNTSNGTQIQIYQRNNTNAQRFKIQDDVTYSYVSHRLKFSTLDEWIRAMKASQQNAAGINGGYIYNSSGSRVCSKAVVGCQVLKYKTITVRTQYGHNIGQYHNVKIKLPYEVQYTIHKHHYDRKVTFCVEDLKTTYSCTCGYHDVYSWEIPWPDVSDFKTIQAKPVFTQYHKNAFW